VGGDGDGVTVSGALEVNRGVRAQVLAAGKALEGDDRQTDDSSIIVRYLFSMYMSCVGQGPFLCYYYCLLYISDEDSFIFGSLIQTRLIFAACTSTKRECYTHVTVIH